MRTHLLYPFWHFDMHLLNIFYWNHYLYRLKRINVFTDFIVIRYVSPARWIRGRWLKNIYIEPLSREWRSISWHWLQQILGKEMLWKLSDTTSGRMVLVLEAVPDSWFWQMLHDFVTGRSFTRINREDLKYDGSLDWLWVSDFITHLNHALCGAAYSPNPSATPLWEHQN